MGLIWFALCIVTMLFWGKTGETGYLELAKLFGILTTVSEFSTPIADWIRARRDLVKIDIAMKQWTYNNMKGDPHD